MNINEVITDTRIFMQHYIIRDGYVFQPLTYPANVYDAIVIRNPIDVPCRSPQIPFSGHSLLEHIELINQMKIQKAVVIADNIDFITDCPTLTHIDIIPSEYCDGQFDFSPLYNMPEVKSLYCNNQYGSNGQYLSEIDYSKVKGLVNAHVINNKAALHINRVKTLKSLSISGYNSQSHNLHDMFVSEELDTLGMNQCGIHSLDGIEVSKKMQCLYLNYNRSLRDICALYKVRSTLKALRIKNCPRIDDFSVLGDLDCLELLQLSGRNVLPTLQFIRSMKSLKTFVFDMNVLDGDITPCQSLLYAASVNNRKHFNLKDDDLPKLKYMRGNENIDNWRRFE